ncbi:MAG: ribonuclease HI [Clostridia bacterium]|nr:ribonuclease HI [Clostridia bacterium]
MKKIDIYTDGACSGNPGPGGYAGILIYGSKEKIISGGDSLTTNNRMELMAVIKSLQALKEICEVDLYTDSAYVCNAITQGWLEDWQLKNWKNSQKKPVLNKDLWLELLEMLTKHKVNFIKVKGHSDNYNNNRCDEIARNEILKLS